MPGGSDRQLDGANVVGLAADRISRGPLSRICDQSSVAASRPPIAPDIRCDVTVGREAASAAAVLACGAPRNPLVICPTGSFAKFVSSPPEKNISLVPSGKSPPLVLATPSRERGVGHRHERWAGCGGRGSVGRAIVVAGRDEPRERLRACKTNGASAYGKAVWSWHPLPVSSRRRFWQARPGAPTPSIRRRR
jgi:hypothetical protein